MSALGEYYRAMGAAAMDQARAAHGHNDVGFAQAQASQTGANAAMRSAQSQAVLHAAQAFLTNQQGKVVIPMSQAQMGLMTAQAGHFGAASRNLDMSTTQMPYNDQSRRNVEEGQAAVSNQTARGLWGDNQVGHLRDSSGNPLLGPTLPTAPDQLYHSSPLVGAPPDGGMPPPPPTIGQTPSAAPMPSIGDVPSVSPSQAIGSPGVPGAGVQSPFKGEGGAYDYSGSPAPADNEPKYAKGTSRVGGMPGYADGVSSVGPALMGAPMPSYSQVTGGGAGPQSQPLPSAPSAGALIGVPAPNFSQPSQAPAQGQAQAQRQPAPQLDQSRNRTVTAPPEGQGGIAGEQYMRTGHGGYQIPAQNGDYGGGISVWPPDDVERRVRLSPHDLTYQPTAPTHPGGRVVPHYYDHQRGGAEVYPRDPGPAPYAPHWADGTSHITAPGDGTVDTTKANLANGEAVLNKGAAEHLGQPAIRALNAVGAARMGMVPGAGARDPQVKQANAAQTAGKTGAGNYAKGTSKAGPKGKSAPPAKADAKAGAKDTKAGAKPTASDTPSLDQIDPKMLAAVMQMGALGQQGGGQPAPDPQQAPPQQQMPMGAGAPMGMM